EAIVIALAVVDVEARGFFLMERTGRPHVALGLVRLAHVPDDLAPHHLTDGDAIAKFVQESGGQRHAIYIGPRKTRVEGAWPRPGRFSLPPGPPFAAFRARPPIVGAPRRQRPRPANGPNHSRRETHFKRMGPM